MRVATSLVVLTCLALLACEPGPTTITTAQSVTYRRLEDPDEQRQLKDAMAAAGVRHEVVQGADGKEYLRWNTDQQAAAEGVEQKLFGPPLPSGRHVSFGADADSFKAWLASNKIPFETVTNRGREYVVWAAEDSPRVAKWDRFPGGYWTVGDRQRSTSSPPGVIKQP